MADVAADNALRVKRLRALVREWEVEHNLLAMQATLGNTRAKVAAADLQNRIDAVNKALTVIRPARRTKEAQ